MSATTVPDPSLLFLMPAMPPPPGVKSNFRTPATNASTIRILNGLFLGLATIFVLVRIYIRTTLPKGQRFGWDDGTCILALLSSIAHTVLVYLILDLGYGRHLWDVRAISVTHDRLTLFAGVDIVYTATIFLVKLSILLLYHRLFSIYDTSKRLIIAGHVIIALIMVTALGNSIARVAVCTSVQTSISIAFCSGKNVNIVIITAAALNAFADFYMLAIPINRVLKMQITTKKRIGLLIIFLSGVIACSMSIVRLAMVISHLHSPDVLWNASRVTPFTIIEMNLGIMCSCMMFTPSFLRKGRMAARSMKSLLGHGNKSGGSVSNVNSSSRADHVVGQMISGSGYINTEIWEQNVPDLELLTDQDPLHPGKTKHQA